MKKGFSVIMPTYNQASFIRRAISSLQGQTYTNWELIIINDGCTDETEFFIADFLTDSKIKYIKNDRNEGLGCAINQGFEIAEYEYIAYLPSDDFYDKDHLESLREKLDGSEEIVLAFSGVRYDESENKGLLLYKQTEGLRPNYNLLLVQTAHKRTEDRWIERQEYVSDDLFFTFWRKLTDKGVFVPTKKITCEWTNHPNQRHRITSERFGGGLNRYRRYYKVQTPIKMRATNYKTIDENLIYKPFKEKKNLSINSLKILLVGELAYNPERIYAFEEAGHKLYGLWANPAFCFSTVGPLPFGNVEDIPYENWRERLQDINPDVVYAQLSTGAIDIAYEVMKSDTGIPFVWHFKEGPHEAMKSGLWSKLIDLYTYADGRIYLNDEIKEWFEMFIPSQAVPRPALVLDGDLPKGNCFNSEFSKKLSKKDGALHIVNIGRLIGISPADVHLLAKTNIHVHVYNENHISEEAILLQYREAAPNHFHVHPHCSQLGWVKEFSKYDAGLLHSFNSLNCGSLYRAGWSDLNLPARINTLAAAGIPMIQKSNPDHIVAMRSYVEKYNMGVFYKDIKDLVSQLKDRKKLEEIEQSVREQRLKFTFDYHVPFIIQFFREVINKTNEKRAEENSKYTFAI
ncbi:glycosyltransferase involved in cell wall biosynthesis [Arcticibacter tournemirensis]|uniref:glycosyltransferase family 2 protein n=1 Tax=Arcticibacter tournemirensis TaxID=699437 RepID=UPI001154C613|nr:glycosyltransferase family 2 protein [Arcticibacter tournemirensis]TQM51507.1 glycosyltransferase involved in cell wall biosynthesis [Arcticibacter tournemirensis]